MVRRIFIEEGRNTAVRWTWQNKGYHKFPPMCHPSLSPGYRFAACYLILIRCGVFAQVRPIMLLEHANIKLSFLRCRPTDIYASYDKILINFLLKDIVSVRPRMKSTLIRPRPFNVTPGSWLGRSVAANFGCIN